MAKKRKLKKKAKTLLGILAAVVLALCVFAGWKIYQSSVRRAEIQQVYDSLALAADEATLRVDCGSAFDIQNAVQYTDGTLSAEGTVDTNTIGSYPLTLKLSKETSFGETVTREFPVNVEVIDNTVPEITLNQDVMEVRLGTEDADLDSNIALVTDGKDGDLPKSDTETPGSYCITTDADYSSAGEYTVTVTALDLDGHRTEKDFRLVVNAADEATNPYRIRINRELNTVTVYALGTDGTYSVPLKAMVCSTGGATPVGVFHTFNRGEWRALFGGVYGQYVTDIVGDILFHSVPYYSMNKGDLEYLEYNKLGTKASMGCIRLCVADALWIFQNCPIGTEVEIYDDPSDPGPLGKPESIYIDPESEIRGWDPTDPSPENPWNN